MANYLHKRKKSLGFSINHEPFSIVCIVKWKDLKKLPKLKFRAIANNFDGKIGHKSFRPFLLHLVPINDMMMLKRNTILFLAMV